MNTETTSPSGDLVGRHQVTDDGVDGAAPFNVPSTSSLMEAEATRDALRVKLDAARARLVEIDAGRAELAYEALSVGGEAARELTKLNKARGVSELDIQNLESAVLEASRRVDDAERAEALAEDGEKASQAMELAADLLLYGKAIDEPSG